MPQSFRCFTIPALLFGLSLASAGCDDMYDARANPPVIPGETLADPDVIEYRGQYYLYGTSAAADHYDVFVSADGQHWEKQGEVFAKPSTMLWAPHVFRDPVSKKFYLYYSLDFDIGVAVADSPTGPFVDAGILIDDAIDAFMYFEDGDYYLYYSTIGEGITSLEALGKRMFEGMFARLFGGDDKVPRAKIYVQRMDSPTKVSGEPMALLQPSDDWEQGYSLDVVEAPWVLREGDTYYLMYSGSPTHESRYAVGYATADNPLGPFRKSPGNPILYSTSDPDVFGANVFGPGHHSVVRAPDGKLWIFFHQNAASLNLGMGQRYIARGELVIDDASDLKVTLGGEQAADR